MQHWASATHLAKNPVIALWRSAYAPISNYHIDRPALLWDSARGVAQETLAAQRQGLGDCVRLPATVDELRAHLDDEVTVSLRALRDAARAYEDRRWSPGKLESVADALWRASDGYLDMLDAARRAPRVSGQFGSRLAHRLEMAFDPTKHSHAADRALMLLTVREDWHPISPVSRSSLHKPLHE